MVKPVLVALLSPVVGDVKDLILVESVLKEFSPTIIFHAAAHKHVPLMELNPSEAVKNNVGGTRTLVQAANRYAVEKVIMISTDKAVNPTSIMGATKRVAELIVHCALERKESRGLHYNLDYPDMQPNPKPTVLTPDRE